METENKERLSALCLLAAESGYGSVFDELEHILRHAPNLAEHFGVVRRDSPVADERSSGV